MRNRPWSAAAPKRASNDNLPEPGKRKTETRTVGGKRVRITTSRKKDGTINRTMAAAPILEWKLQAAAIKRLKSMVKAGMNFTYAGDMNGLPIFSPQGKVRAKATGMMSGEFDVRVYMPGARLGLIEYKNEEGDTFDNQDDRHALLASLGFTLQAVVKCKTEQEAADQTEALVRGWMGIAAEDVAEDAA